MKPELTANLWAFLDSSTGMIYAVAGRAYQLSGTDEEMLATLRSLSKHDFQSATRIGLGDRFKVIYANGEEKIGVTKPQAMNDPNSMIFEEVLKQIEAAQPPISDFARDITIKQKFPEQPLCIRTTVFEDDAGVCRAIVTEQDKQWLQGMMR